MLFRCYVPLFFVSTVVAAACDFVCAQERASMREKVRSATQLDGTVVAVLAWCCVLPLLLLLLLWLVVLLFLQQCICYWLVMVVVVVLVAVLLFVSVVIVGFLLSVVGCAHVL